MDGREKAASSETPCPPELLNKWIDIQDSLKRKVVNRDDFSWKLSSDDEKYEKGESCEELRYVGGVDLSFSKEDPSVACGSLVVLDIKSLEIVYEDFSVVKLNIPYVPGFLAFREAPVLLGLLEKMKRHESSLYPQLLMVDGNGLLHPRGFGLACHLGVLANLPTVGIGKNLHHVDGLNQSRVRGLLELEENSGRDILTLVGDSGCTLGAAMRSSEGSVKPIYISVGHRVSLSTAIKVVKMTCRYRVPEPIRQADIRSRDFLQQHCGLTSTAQSTPLGIELGFEHSPNL